MRKCFEALNSEQKPEHVGVRAALETLFAEYRRSPGSGVADDVESYVEYCYSDDMYMELDIDATSRFFEWLGVVRPAGCNAQSHAPRHNPGAAKSALTAAHEQPRQVSSMPGQVPASRWVAPNGPHWPCPACTYANVEDHLQCFMCLTIRPEGNQGV